MNERIKEMADLCISHFLPITIARSVGDERQIISLLPYDLIESKTAGIIVEGKVIDRVTYKFTEEMIYLTEEEFIGASLGLELADE